MTNMMVALPNIGGALCSTPQSLADAHYWSAVGGGAENARLENAELENAAPNCRTGKRETGKLGTKLQD